ncbi:MAG: flagellar hook-basal body complex protein [Alphaproteobacteria bacterium]|nr:flagellar hook-basal body complex protein [Alphaproteobacteria bacterium]
MTIMNAFVPITSAIRNSADRFANISDSVNLQNVNGAKRSRLAFSSLLGDSDFYASKNASRSTGTKFHTRQNISAQGAITPTGRGLDLSINGYGFFAVLSNPNALDNNSGDTPPTDINADDFNDDDFSTTDLANNFHLSRDGSFSFKQYVRQDDDGTITDRPQYIVDKDGHFLLGWQTPLDEDVDISIPRSNSFPERTLANLSPLQLNPESLISRAHRTTTVNAKLNLPHDTSITANTDYPQLITVYDNEGNPRSMNLNFRYSGTENQWEFMPRFVDENGKEIDSADPLTTTLNFDSQGKLISDETIGISYEGGSFNLNLSNLTSYGKDYTLESITQDGYPEGNLKFFEIDTSGIIKGTFDNGRTETIAQIPIFDVANRNSLTPYNSTGGPKFSLNEHNMKLQVHDLLQTQHSRINSGTIELSTIDLAEVFSEMIETQHSYTIANNALQIINDMTQVAYRLKA